MPKSQPLAAELSAPEPGDEDLVAFAESLLKNVSPHLRARHVLEVAIEQHRATWLTLYEAAGALRRIGTADKAV